MNRLLILALILAAASAFAAPAQTTKPLILDNQECGKAETTVGDLVADAFRTTMKSDIAFVSAGDLKPESMTLESTTVKPDDVTPLILFPDDALVVLALDGRMIRQALETSVSSTPKPSLSFLQVSGLKMTYDPSRPVGQRITALTVAGLPVTNDRSYTVVMLNSLANGALGYWKIWSKRNIVPTSASSTSAAAIDTYLKTNPKIDFTAQGRIVRS